MKKLRMSLALIIALMLVLAACSSPATPAPPAAQAPPAAEAPQAPQAPDNSGSGGGELTGGPYTIRIVTATGGTHQQYVTMEEFKTNIEAASNGKISVELYPYSQFGTSAQMIEAVQDATVEAVLLPTSYFASYAPLIAILDLPFLFEYDLNQRSSEQACRILNGGTSLDAYMESRGLTPGGYMLGADRYYLTKSEINSLSDLFNTKIWALPSPTLQAELTAYGASPATLNPGDIAVALQNGTIDGVQTDPTFYVTMKLYEHAKFINTGPASAMSNAWYWSTDWLATLPEDVKKLIMDTASKAILEYEYEYMQTFLADSLKTMTEAGVKIIPSSDELLAEMKAASSGLHDDYKSKGADYEALYNEFVELIAKDSAAN